MTEKRKIIVEFEADVPKDKVLIADQILNKIFDGEIKASYTILSDFCMCKVSHHKDANFCPYCTKPILDR